jgi:hypothetical protein
MVDEECDSSNGNLIKFFEERDRRYAELALAEAKRIDAIMLAEARRVDALLLAAANDVSLATSRAEHTASGLAERVEASAKALAAQVEATAKAAAIAVEATAKILADRIRPLEEARYVQAGRAGLSTPLLAAIAALAGGLLLWVFEHLIMRGQ